MRLTRARRVSYSVTAALAIGLLSASCTSGGTAGSAGAATHIVVGALPVVDDVGLYIAQDQGLFKKVGLSVTIKPELKSTAAIPEMMAGTINIIGGANNVSFIGADAKDPANMPFRLVSEAATCGAGTFDVLALPGSGISKPANLKGKRIAVNLLNNVQTLTINAILKDDGVNPSSVHYVEIAFPAMIAALQAHQVDAISAVEPFATAAELNTGAEPILDQCQGPTQNFPISSYYATSTWVKQNPATVAAFQQAMAQAQAIADNSRGTVEKTIMTYIPKLTAVEADILALETFPTTVDAVQLQRVADLMFTGHLLNAKFKVTSILAG